METIDRKKRTHSLVVIKSIVTWIFPLILKYEPRFHNLCCAFPHTVSHFVSWKSFALENVSIFLSRVPVWVSESHLIRLYWKSGEKHSLHCGSIYTNRMTIQFRLSTFHTKYLLFHQNLLLLFFGSWMSTFLCPPGNEYGIPMIFPVSFHLFPHILFSRIVEFCPSQKVKVERINDEQSTFDW